MSSAKDQFLSSVQAVRSLSQLESEYDDPPKKSFESICFGLRGAATVLTVACFEGFLRSVFEEELDRIHAAGTPLSRYDEGLRTSAVFASLEQVLKDQSAGAKKSERVDTVVAAARAVGADTFIPKALASTNSNPDAACIKDMFKTVGKKDVFTSINRDYVSVTGDAVHATYCEDRLNSIVTSRHQVAHTADAAHVTRAEMNSGIGFVETLADVIHRILSQHVEDMIGRASFDTGAI